MKLLTYLYTYLLFIQYAQSYLIYPKFFNIEIYNRLKNLSKYTLKTPIILNGKNVPYKKDMCKLISLRNNIPFYEFNINDFEYKVCNYLESNSIIYVSDFLIDENIKLHDYEKNILNELCPVKPLIIFNSINIDKILQNNFISKKFNIYEFPIIKKTDILKHIHELIEIFNYDDTLYKINWLSYDVESLELEKLNILLYEVNNLLNEIKKNKSIDNDIYNKNINNEINVDKLIKSLHF
jgi:hypothetical protein